MMNVEVINGVKNGELYKHLTKTMNIQILKRAIEFSIVKKSSLQEHNKFIGNLITKLGGDILITNLLIDKNRIEYLLLSGNTLIIYFDENLDFVNLELKSVNKIKLVYNSNNNVINEIDNYISEELETLPQNCKLTFEETTIYNTLLNIQNFIQTLK